MDHVFLEHVCLVGPEGSVAKVLETCGKYGLIIGLYFRYGVLKVIERGFSLVSPDFGGEIDGFLVTIILFDDIFPAGLIDATI